MSVELSSIGWMDDTMMLPGRHLACCLVWILRKNLHHGIARDTETHTETHARMHALFHAHVTLVDSRHDAYLYYIFHGNVELEGGRGSCPILLRRRNIYYHMDTLLMK